MSYDWSGTLRNSFRFYFFFPGWTILYTVYVQYIYFRFPLKTEQQLRKVMISRSVTTEATILSYFLNHKINTWPKLCPFFILIAKLPTCDTTSTTTETTLVFWYNLDKDFWNDVYVTVYSFKLSHQISRPPDNQSSLGP